VETFAFHSYKGGVGRSLLLANAARFLATLGKGVVAFDFDFEAPGLHYKLGVEQGPGVPSFTGGAVPYLLATAKGTASPPHLEDHMISVAVPRESAGWLRLMPAGPAPHQTYWAALQQLGDKLRMGDSSGQGFMALVDLQARVADELNPDYLLIDAHAGVTYLGGLAATVLADTVVCISGVTSESFEGMLQVVEALRTAPRLAHQKPLRTVPVLSRAAETDRAGYGVAYLHSREIGERIFALPHEDLDASEIVSASSPLYKAYMGLFQELFLSATELAPTAPPGHPRPTQPKSV
jgi:MinD-like ATPase involved in chromosome partitioning or flagellar assembly